MLNNFIQAFTDILNTGIDSLKPIILFITTTVAIIDFNLAFIYQYSEEFTNITKIFFQKMFKYASLFALVNYYDKIIAALIELMFTIGYKFFPSRIGEQYVTNDGKIDFDSIYGYFMDSIININKEREKLGQLRLGDHIVYIAIMVVALIAVFLIIKEIIVSFIKLRAIATVGYFLVPFNAFEQSKAMGEKLFHGILAELGVLLTSICLTGITLQVMETRAYTPSATGKAIFLGDSMAWLFMLLLSAFLVTQAKEFGSMLINGTAAGKGSNVLASGLTNAVATGAAVVGAVYTGGTSLAAGSAGAYKAMKNGKDLKGIMNSAKEGMKKGREYAQNTRIARAGRRINSGIQKTIAYGSGQRSLTNLGKDVVGGVLGTIGDQTIDYNSDNMRKDREALFEDSVGELKDYAGTQKINEAIKSAKSEYTKALNEELKGLDNGEKVNKLSKYTKALGTFMKEYGSKENREASYEAGRQKMKQRKEFDNKQNRELWEEFRQRDKFITGKDTWKKFKDTSENRKKFNAEMKKLNKKKEEEGKKDIFNDLASNRKKDD